MYGMKNFKNKMSWLYYVPLAIGIMALSSYILRAIRRSDFFYYDIRQIADYIHAFLQENIYISYFIAFFPFTSFVSIWVAASFLEHKKISKKIFLASVGFNLLYCILFVDELMHLSV